MNFAIHLLLLHLLLHLLLFVSVIPTPTPIQRYVENRKGASSVGSQVQLSSPTYSPPQKDHKKMIPQSKIEMVNKNKIEDHTSVSTVPMVPIEKHKGASSHVQLSSRTYSPAKDLKKMMLQRKIEEINKNKIEDHTNVSTIPVPMVPMVIADAKVVVCTIAIKEEQYVDEWLRHYQYLGFDHVYLYDNSDTPSEYLFGLKEVYGNFLVVIHQPGESQQVLVYHDFFARHRRENMWVAIIDADEYIALRKHETIKDFLLDLAPKGGAVELNWKRFSNCGVKKRGPGPIVSRFTYTTKEVSRYVKTISYLPHVSALHIHHSSVAAGKTKIDVKGRHKPLVQFAFSDDRRGNGDVAYIAHYHTKSLEEYILKRKRGQADHVQRGGHVTYSRIAGEFERYNTPYCEVEDTFVRDFYLRHYFGSAYKPGNGTSAVIASQ